MSYELYVSSLTFCLVHLIESTDQQCNLLAWKCLGYKYNAETQLFELSNDVFPKWAAKYPIPPDLIGTRFYILL